MSDGQPVPAVTGQASEAPLLGQLWGYARAVQPYLLAAWVFGVVCLSARLLLGVVAARWLRQSHETIPSELACSVARLSSAIGLRSAATIRVSSRIREAMVVGVLRPMVLLPAAWITEMTPEILEAVIAHELAHIRRWDLWATLFQRLVETLLFYHPAVWWISRRVSSEREKCCDELAVAATGRRVTYARALEKAASIRLAPTEPLFGAAFGGRKMAIFERVSHVLGIATPNQRARWWPVGILALLVPLGIWLASANSAESEPVAVETKQTPEDSSTEEDTQPPPKEQSQKQQLQRLRQFLSTRLDQPAENGPPEALVFQPVRDHLLNSLMAVNVDTGKARHVADIVGGVPRVVARFGPHLVLVQTGMVIGGGTVREAVTNDGGELIDRRFMLVDLRTGETEHLWPLEERTTHHVFMSLAPNKRKLAFKTNPEWSKHLLEVLDLDTLQVRVLQEDCDDIPNWSPDSRLVISSKMKGEGEDSTIVFIDAQTGNVTNTAFKGMLGTFMPDGEKIVFYQDVSSNSKKPMKLLIAPILGGKAEELASITGGWPRPAIPSPDGSRLLYGKFKREAASESWELHEINLQSGHDRVVLDESRLFGVFANIRWLDAHSTVLVASTDYSPEPPPKYVPQIRLISLGGDKPAVREIAVKAPERSGSVMGAIDAAIDQLLKVFVAKAQASEAEDLHRLEEAHAKYTEARDLLVKILGEMRQGKTATLELLHLQPEDVQSLLEQLTEDANMSRADRSVRIVRRNLQYRLYSLFRLQYQGRLQPPAEQDGKASRKDQALVTGHLDLKECARKAPGAGWSLGGTGGPISGKDIQRVRRLFVVPGDNHDKVLTSYEVIKPDTGDGVLVIRTPILPNGKRLEATYRVKKTEKGHIHVESEVKEVD